MRVRPPDPWAKFVLLLLLVVLMVVLVLVVFALAQVTPTLEARASRFVDWM
jgi:hypothetical protein